MPPPPSRHPRDEVSSRGTARRDSDYSPRRGPGRDRGDRRERRDDEASRGISGSHISSHSADKTGPVEPAAEEDGALPIGTEEVSLSVEETNKLRIALGLRPLDEGGTSAKDQAAMANFAQERMRQKKRDQRREIIERVAKEQNKLKVQQKLSGKGLGDASDGEDDSYSWAIRHKDVARERKLAELKAREAEEQDKMVLASYDSEDLKGLRIGHAVDDINDDILVLSDKRVLDEDAEDDELVSVNIAEKERLRKNLENKSKKSAYNGYDDDEFKNPGQKKSILSQYDEEIDGPVRVGFVIGQEPSKPAEDENANDHGKPSLSLEYDKMQEIRDYYTTDELVSFAKPKKRKKKAKTRVRMADEDELDPPQTNSMDVEETEPVRPLPAFSTSNKSTNIADVNFVDDDDLQAALAKARRLAARPIVRSTPEDIARLAQASNADEVVIPDGSGLVLSSTSEFVRNLSNVPTFQVPKPEPVVRRKFETSDNEDDDHDVKMDGDGTHDDETVKSEDVKTEVKHEEEGEDALAPGGIEEEPLVANGLAATLSLLKQKGFIEKIDEDQLEKERRQKERAKWAAEQRLKDQLRTLEREKEKARQRAQNKAKGGKGGGYVDEWQQEEENRQAERQRQRELEERFKNYTPDIDIKYTDEFGQEMTPKEAFRFLSHKFHGKSSGKMKTEKRLLRKEDEIKLQKMVSTDTPLNTASALAERTRQLGSAHVVLAVGNRGVLPADVSLSSVGRGGGGSAMPLKKGKAAAGKGGKGTPRAAAASGDGSGDASSGAPVGFVEAVPAQAAPVAPVGERREKVAFGLALGAPKRKAEAPAFEESVPKKFKDVE